MRFLSSFLALDSRFLFSTVGSSWHRVYVFPLFAHVSCFPRLTAASSFPARFNKFLHACCRFVFSHPYHWLHYFCCPHWRTCLLRSRHLSCHATRLPLQPLKRKRSIVVTGRFHAGASTMEEGKLILSVIVLYCHDYLNLF